MTRAFAIHGLFLVLAVTADGTAAAPDVVAFTVSWMPMTGAEGVEVHVLDAAERYAERLAEDLPEDRGRAQAEVRRRMAVGRGEVVAGSVAAGRLAQRLGVTRLPAVVVDGRFAVYGVRDVGEALDLVARWRAGEDVSRAARSAVRRSAVRSSSRVQRQ